MTTTYVGPSPAGFVPTAVVLPARREDVPQERREHAALLVVAIGLGATPEDIAAGDLEAARVRLRDPLERAEALAHVDLLLSVLAPPAGASR